MVQKSSSARNERSTRGHTNQCQGSAQTLANPRAFLGNWPYARAQLPLLGSIAQISIKAASGAAVRSIEDCCQ